MTSCDDSEFAAIDDYIRTELAEAAQRYASQVDLDARLKEVIEAEEAES
jgi:hypothetical protein